MKSLRDVKESVKQKPSLRISVAVAEDLEVLEAVEEAQRNNLAHFILFGNRNKMEAIAENENIPLHHTGNCTY